MRGYTTWQKIFVVLGVIVGILVVLALVALAVWGAMMVKGIRDGDVVIVATTPPEVAETVSITPPTVQMEATQTPLPPPVIEVPIATPTSLPDEYQTLRDLLGDEEDEQDRANQFAAIRTAMPSPSLEPTPGAEAVEPAGFPGLGGLTGPKTAAGSLAAEVESKKVKADSARIEIRPAEDLAEGHQIEVHYRAEGGLIPGLKTWERVTASGEGQKWSADLEALDRGTAYVVAAVEMNQEGDEIRRSSEVHFKTKAKTGVGIGRTGAAAVALGLATLALLWCTGLTGSAFAAHTGKLQALILLSQVGVSALLWVLGFNFYVLLAGEVGTICFLLYFISNWKDK